MASLSGVLDRMFSRPSGVLGRIGGSVMARTNGDVAAQVVAALDLDSTDSVLEVGFGPGVGVERAAGVVTEGRVAGVDYSETMVERARRRNARAIEAGRVDLRYGSVETLPFAGDTFDVAFSINSLHVWPDQLAGLREIRRVLRPGGTVSIALTAHAGRPEDDLDRLLRDAGFEYVRRVAEIDADCVVGRVPRRG